MPVHEFVKGSDSPSGAQVSQVSRVSSPPLPPNGHFMGHLVILAPYKILTSGVQTYCGRDLAVAVSQKQCLFTFWRNIGREI